VLSSGHHGLSKRCGCGAVMLSYPDASSPLPKEGGCGESDVTEA